MTIKGWVWADREEGIRWLPFFPRKRDAKACKHDIRRATLTIEEPKKRAKAKPKR